MIRNAALLALAGAKAAAVLALAAGAAWAQPVKTSHSTVELIAEQGSLPAAGGALVLGLRLAPDPTWHAYWVNPGDAGKEPSMKWTLPEGFEAGPLQFPAPHLVPFGDLNTYAFEEPIVLLAEVAVPGGLAPGEILQLGGEARWVVCDDALCVPERARLSLRLAVDDGAADPAAAQRFAAAWAKIPQLVDWQARFALADGEVRFQIAPPAEAGAIAAPYLFVQPKRVVRYGYQTWGQTPRGLSFAMQAGAKAEGWQSLPAVLSYADASGASRSVALVLERTEDSLAAPSKSGGATGGAAGAGGAAGGSSGGSGAADLGTLSLGKAVLFAFLGGIVLNLMPCVFPILSMKALSLVNLSRADLRIARQSGLLYTAGILAAFALVGAALLALRQGGQAVGWGFQMQSPFVNVGLGLLMLAIGLNLFGVFEIGARLMGAGASLAEGGERKSAFFTGLLAVVVATPCTAPFMAGALGYALVQPPALALAVFLVLGFGLAFPYLLLSLIPSLSRALPRPGPWMATLRSLLAFPMLATALWLFWIVGRQLGATSMSVALLAALCLAFALWAFGRSAAAVRRPVWQAAAVLGLIACVALSANVKRYLDAPGAMAEAAPSALGGLQPERFSPERVKGYIAEGQPAFVYFTADWCVSCKVNERVALATDAVANAFQERGVKVVEADWTAEDPVITEWLEMYDRVGVPLYLYFPQGSSLATATILPQILLPQIVINALDRADHAAA